MKMFRYVIKHKVAYQSRDKEINYSYQGFSYFYLLSVLMTRSSGNDMLKVGINRGH